MRQCIGRDVANRTAIKIELNDKDDDKTRNGKMHKGEEINSAVSLSV